MRLACVLPCIWVPLCVGQTTPVGAVPERLSAADVRSVDGFDGIGVAVPYSGAAQVVGFLDREPYASRLLPVAVIDPVTVRAEFGRFYIVDRGLSAVIVLDGRGRTLRVIPVGAGSGPVDIAVVSPRLAYVSRANRTTLLMIDPETGLQAPSFDLAPFADADGNPNMAWMHVVGDRLFVQLQYLDAAAPGQYAPRGALGVVDLTTGHLVDADPGLPGVQAVELNGPAPRLKMHATGDALLVGATGLGFYDYTGGLDAVDLDTLTVGPFVVSEMDTANIGAFEMITDDLGYMVFHTDIIASSHLIPFTVSGGAGLGPETALELGGFVEALGETGDGLLLMPGIDPALNVIDPVQDTRIARPALPTSIGLRDFAVRR